MNTTKSKNVTVCELIVGFYLNAPVTLMVDDSGRLAGLDKGFLKLTFQAPPSKTDRNSPWVIMVNDTRGHVVGAARDIKDPRRPTDDEMKNLATAMRKTANIQVRQSPGGNEFVNVSYPGGNRQSQGYFAVNYTRPNAPVYDKPEKGQLLWGMESKGANGTVQVMLVQTRFNVVMDATKPEAKPETPVPATDSNEVPSDEHNDQTT